MWYVKIIVCIVAVFIATCPAQAGEIEGIRTPDPLRAGSADGTLSINGQTFTLKHAYASSKSVRDGEAEILLTEKLLPEDALFGRLISLMRKGGTCFRVRIATSTHELKGIHLRTSDGFQTSASSSKYVFEPASAKPDSIAGKLIGTKEFEDDPSFEVSFSAPVQSKFELTGKEIIKLRKSPIGQAVAAFVKAVRSGDKEALRPLLSVESAAKLGEPDAEEGISSLKMMLEEDKQLVEIRPTGKDKLAARLEFKDDSGGISGMTLLLTKENGVWKVYGE